MADYQVLKDWLYQLQVFGIKLGLSSTEALLDRLGRPQDAFPAVHLAGTNGKGSTAVTLTQILIDSGYKVGLYTSPHLVNMRERFLVNFKMPTKDRLAGTMAKIQAVCSEEEPPTFFEYTTALGFEYFKEEAVDIAVIETGMGGRLDATNIVDPEVSIICDIGREHTQYLGTTIRQIAGEKAGIIKPGRPVVTTARTAAARQVITARAEELNAPLRVYGSDFSARWTKSGLTHRGLGSDWRFTVQPALYGPYQRYNTSAALVAAELLSRSGFNIDPAVAAQSPARVRWPGRFHKIEDNPTVIIDGAHNPQALRALFGALERYPHKRLICVMGAMADKDLEVMIGLVGPRVDQLILSSPAYARSAKPEALKVIADRLGLASRTEPDLIKALELAKSKAGPGDLVLAAGSLFLVGEILERTGRAPIFEETT